jgi:hypothetical protein
MLPLLSVSGECVMHIDSEFLFAMLALINPFVMQQPFLDKQTTPKLLFLAIWANHAKRVFGAA